jgi:heparan-alpha-glucosaminide N-acetyltransferase
VAVATGSLPAVEQPVASRRLTSLDVVRGLAVAVMVIVENLPGPLESFRWWRHAAWHGLTIADVVFPLFLVATGAGMAFWLRPPVSARTLRRLAVRSLALIAIGVVVFGWWGEGGGLDSLRIPGVLQRIGVAGLIAGVVVAGLRRWWAIAAVVALLLVGYGWTLTSPTVDGCRGVDVPACTVPGEIDAATFGSAHLYRDGDAGYDPEGLPSTAGAVASVLIGWLAGELLRRRRLPELAGLGAVCFGAGLLWSHAIEVNKRLWTPSFVLVTAAISIGLLLVAHAAVDRPGLGARAAWPIVALGRNALLVYVGQHVVGVWLSRVHVGDVTASTWLLEHVVQRGIAPPGAYLVYALGMLAVWTAISCVLHARRWYVTL